MSILHLPALHALWFTVLAICAAGWVGTVVAHLLLSARRRESLLRLRAQITDLVTQKNLYVQQREEYATLLTEARRRLADESERNIALVEHFEDFKKESVARQRLAQTRPALTAQVGEEDSKLRQQIQKLEASLAEMRRSRDAAEKQVKSLLAANRTQTQTIVNLTAQLDQVAANVEETRVALVERQRGSLDLSRQVTRLEEELQAERILAAERLESANKQVEQLRAQVAQLSEGAEQQTVELQERKAAYEALERMLQESTTLQFQLRRDLTTVTRWREQIELQNLELKKALEKINVDLDGLSAPEPKHSIDSFISLSHGAVNQWQEVTDSDIHDAVVDLTEVKPQVERVQTAWDSDESLPPEARVSEQALREARMRIEVLEANMSDLEYLREQNAKLTEEWQQDRGAARELSALSMEHRRLKLDLQLAQDRLSTQSQSLERMAELQAELKESQDEQLLIQSLRKQVRDLSTENFALQNVHSGTYSVAPPARGLESDATQLTGGPIDAAVLSDHLGLPIAATGTLPAEALAAVSGLAARNAEHVRELVPLGDIAMIQWTDQQGMTVTSKLLRLSGDEVVMTTIGAGAPSEDALRRKLAEVLHSIGWTEHGPIPEDDQHAATG